MTQIESHLNNLTQRRVKSPLLSLPKSERRIYAGPRFLKISKVSKDATAREIIAIARERAAERDQELIVVAIGDQSVDVPMYREADIAFHVGSDRIIEKEYLANTTLVRGIDGSLGKNRRGERVKGNSLVLRQLQEAFSKDNSIDNFRYFQIPDENGLWLWKSISDIKGSHKNRSYKFVYYSQILFLYFSLIATLSIFFIVLHIIIYIYNTVGWIQNRHSNRPSIWINELNWTYFSNPQPILLLSIKSNNQERGAFIK